MAPAASEEEGFGAFGEAAEGPHPAQQPAQSSSSDAASQQAPAAPADSSSHMLTRLFAASKPEYLELVGQCLGCTTLRNAILMIGVAEACCGGKCRSGPCCSHCSKAQLQCEKLFPPVRPNHCPRLRPWCGGWLIQQHRMRPLPSPGRLWLQGATRCVEHVQPCMLEVCLRAAASNYRGSWSLVARRPRAQLVSHPLHGRAALRRHGSWRACAAQGPLTAKNPQSQPQVPYLCPSSCCNYHHEDIRLV